MARSALSDHGPRGRSDGVGGRDGRARPPDVLFVLPRWSAVPVGGYRVVYDHARRLAALGLDVEVTHCAWITPRAPLARVRDGARRRLAVRTPVPWCDTAGVRVTSVTRKAWAARGWRLRHGARTTGAPGAAVVATSWQTAQAVAGVTESSGRGFQLVQSYETWSGPVDLVDASWRLPLHKLAIARWLLDVGARLGAGPASYVPNSIDAVAFPCRVPQSDRDPLRVGMLWHREPCKGSSLGVEALARVRERRPGLRPVLFSVYRRPPQIPDWVEWRHRPGAAELPALYNQISTFLAPSHVEGWALPPAEAMSSGAALVATDIGGFRDYARHGETALLAPAGDAEALSRGLETVLAHDDLRTRLADAGRRVIHTEFTPERSTRALLAALSAGDRPPR